MIVVMGNHTYMRSPMPHHMRATCSLCCRPIQVHADGTLYRHGWKETGRKVGEIGLGFQWGECPATNDRPLEQTDEDGLKHVERIRQAIITWEGTAEAHRVGLDSYSHDVEREIAWEGHASIIESESWKMWAASGLEVVRVREETKGLRGYRQRKIEITTYRVVRGYEAQGSRYGARTVSYEALRAGAESVARHNVKQLQEAERMLLAAIEHHRVTEPVRKSESNEPVVHARGRAGRPVCGTRGYSSRTTDDEQAVSCTRCKAIASRCIGRSLVGTR